MQQRDNELRNQAKGYGPVSHAASSEDWASQTLRVRLPEEQAYARRCEIIDEVTVRLKEAGIIIPVEGGKQFTMILAMTVNAFMPEYCCSILDLDNKAKVALLPGGKWEVWNPPNIALQQQVVRYFREHVDLQDALAEGLALSLYLGHPLNWLGNSAIELRDDGLVQAAGDRFMTLDHNAGTVFIPGCGLTSFRMIQDFLSKQGQAQGQDMRFLLCDNHPFVANVANLYCHYLADDRVRFHAASMEEVEIPENTKTVLLSYIEAAGKDPIRRMLSRLEACPDAQVVLVAGLAPNEYSGLTGEEVVRLAQEAGLRVSPSGTRECPSFSTHFVVDGRSVDFVDLSSSQALEVFSLSLNGRKPNTRTLIADLCKT